MKRKDFIRQTLFTGASLTLKASGKPGKHRATPEEEEGPFPTHQPEGLIAKDITSGRTGIPLIIQIAVYDINKKFAGCKDAIVDIWHCDNKGAYSEYGGKDEHSTHAGPGGIQPPPGGLGKRPFKKEKNMPPPPPGGMFGGMQATDYTNVHFLRGRQTTNAKGEVSFHSIYPGWYPGRAPHIHVHIFDNAGKSLLITQIAFPDAISNHVYQRGVYAAHGLPDTTTANDHVFNDSIANELASVTGSESDGFVLKHAIYVKA